MATAVNPITGKLIKTKGSNDTYRDGWDRIFNKPEPEPVKQPEKVVDTEREELVAKWHTWCEDNQNLIKRIPTFEEWKEKHNEV